MRQDKKDIATGLAIPTTAKQPAELVAICDHISNRLGRPGYDAP
jgi:hypothetical protein